MRLIPTEDRIIVQIVMRDETVSEAGIIVPSGGSSDYIEHGIVVEIGPNVGFDQDGNMRRGRYPDVGAKVVVQKIAAPEMLYGGKRSKILKESNVLAIIDETPQEPAPGTA